MTEAMSWPADFSIVSSGDCFRRGDRGQFSVSCLLENRPSSPCCQSMGRNFS